MKLMPFIRQCIVAAVASSVSLDAPAHAGEQRDQEIAELWSEAKASLEPAGITENMFRQVTYWGEAQYLLGYCSAVLNPADVSFWRTWWDGTVLHQSDAGRMLLKTGTSLYERRLADGVAEAPSAELCQRTADDWFADMKRIMEYPK